MRLFLPFLIISVFSLIYSVGFIDAVPSDAVLLRSVTAITLSRGRYTTGRRASPIPQLNCVGGPCQYQPNNVLCKNVGFDGSDVQWACEADLSNGLKFGRVEVLCEGYNHPEDEYILRGSCGLEYTLDGYVQHSSSSYSSSHTTVPSSDSSSGSWISLIVFGLIFYFIYRACSDASRPSGGGGGGGGYSGDNGPPPYGSSVGGGGGGSSYYGGSSSYSPGYSSANCSSSSSSSSGPGFWSGVGAGALGGYLFGRNRSSGYSAPHYSTGPSFSSSSFGGGFSSSSIGTTHSTGYGGTRRR